MVPVLLYFPQIGVFQLVGPQSIETTVLIPKLTTIARRPEHSDLGSVQGWEEPKQTSICYFKEDLELKKRFKEEINWNKY